MEYSVFEIYRFWQDFPNQPVEDFKKIGNLTDIYAEILRFQHLLVKIQDF